MLRDNLDGYCDRNSILRNSIYQAAERVFQNIFFNVNVDSHITCMTRGLAGLRDLASVLADAVALSRNALTSLTVGHDKPATSARLLL